MAGIWGGEDTRITFEQYRKLAQRLRERAYALAKVYTERARDISEKRLGAGRDYAFLCAHNWQGQSWMTPDQNQAAREILWLQSQSFKPSDITDRIIARAWKRVQQ
jgi:hypothetical protein